MQTFRSIARTKMFTPGFKLFAGLSSFALTAAFLFGASSTGKDFRDNMMEILIGPISLGWKGSVGNHVGYVFFVSLMVAAALVGGLLVAFRDADPEAGAEYLQADSIPLTRAPYGTSYWPVAAAGGVACIMLGLVGNMALFWAGVGLLVAVTGVWAFRAWAERATGDDETNLAIYNRFINPVRVPFTSVVLIGLVVISLSRVNLTMPSATASIAVFGAVGAVMFVVFVMLNYMPELKRAAIAAVIVGFGALFIGAGIVGASRGERSFHHETEGGETGGEGHSTESPAGEAPAGEAPAGEAPTTHEGGMAPAGAVTDGAVHP